MGVDPEAFKALQQRMREKRPSSILGEVVKVKAKGKTEKPQNEKLNKTESRYERHLAGLKQAGEILWYRMHAFSLYFEDGTRYTPDAVIMDVHGGITLVDCKAYRKNEKKVHIEEASMLKIKRTAEEYYFFTMKVVYEKDGHWQEMTF
jgi:hypothetical protein